MSGWVRAAAIVCALALSGCAGKRPPRPIRFVAVDLPATVPARTGGALRPIEVSHTRVLPNVRVAEDARDYLRELTAKAGTPYLRNADLRLTTSVCFFVCINTNRASAETGE